jgi:hypothetical protein
VGVDRCIGRVVELPGSDDWGFGVNGLRPWSGSNVIPRVGASEFKCSGDDSFNAFNSRSSAQLNAPQLANFPSLKDNHSYFLKVDPY